jgi:tagatose 1,6-diphosphate aldolase
MTDLKGTRMTISAGKYRGMRRMADASGRFKMTAVDQRPPIKNPIRAKRGTAEAPWEDVASFKELLIRELQVESSAMLLDPHYAFPRGVTMLDPRIGVILTLEESIFREVPGGRLSGEIDDWSVEKIKRAGGDAAKVLTWYRPDADPAVCSAQQDFTQRVGEACARYDIPFVFELLVYPLASDGEQTGEYVEMKTKQAQLVIDSVRAFADPRFGVDLFKLESPVPAADVPEPGAAGSDAVHQDPDYSGAYVFLETDAAGPGDTALEGVGMTFTDESVIGDRFDAGKAIRDGLEHELTLTSFSNRTTGTYALLLVGELPPRTFGN